MMVVAKIGFFDAKQYEIDFFKPLADKYNIHFKFFPSRLNMDTVALANGFSGVCSFTNDDLSKDVLEKLNDMGINFVALRCSGYNNVDLKAAYKKIHIARVPSYSPASIAEHALALILTLNRKTHRAYFRTRDNNFTINGLMGFNLEGKTIGVIGTGAIGRNFIKTISGFDMEILAYDPYPNKDAAKELDFEYVELDKLFSRSDIISLHCPLTPDNVHMLNKSAFDKMKDGVMVINTGRGKLIDTADLIAALKCGKVGSAGLDVYEEETEYFFEDFSNSLMSDDILARLLTFNNVLITSHQGFFTKEALLKIAQTTCENIVNFFENDKLPNEVCYKCGNNNCKKKETGKCF